MEGVLAAAERIKPTPREISRRLIKVWMNASN
jgi:hypothetical protein